MIIPSFIGFLGLLDILIALLLLGSSAFFWFNRGVVNPPEVKSQIRWTELIAVILLFVGVVLFIQGWRLDPILQIAFFLVNVLVFLLEIKDIGIFFLRRNA